MSFLTCIFRGRCIQIKEMQITCWLLWHWKAFTLDAAREARVLKWSQSMRRSSGAQGRHGAVWHEMWASTSAYRWSKHVVYTFLLSCHHRRGVPDQAAGTTLERKVEGLEERFDMPHLLQLYNADKYVIYFWDESHIEGPKRKCVCKLPQLCMMQEGACRTGWCTGAWIYMWACMYLLVTASCAGHSSGACEWV